jgi:hypothetical protein
MNQVTTQKRVKIKGTNWFPGIWTCIKPLFASTYESPQKGVKSHTPKVSRLPKAFFSD